jgi:hypothetical protein
MKYIRLFFLVSAVALTLNMFSVTAHAAETETELQTVTQEASEASEASGESIEVNNSDTIYIVFLLSAIFGSLVAFAFWEIFRG